MPDDKAGKLAKHLFAYVSGRESQLDDEELQVAFDLLTLKMEA